MPQLGKDCKLYRSTTLLDGSSNTPATVSWTEITNVRDLTLTQTKGEADVTTRASSGFRQTLGTLIEGSVEFDMMWETADAGFTALQDAFYNGTEISMAVMDGDIAVTGAEGLASNMNVTGFTRNEPLEEGATVSVTVKPSSYTEWYTKAAS